MKATKAAEWFLGTIPSLQRGYLDENTKLNKLLFFSDLMYSSVNDGNLIDEGFEKWDGGPVIREIYRGYRYENLGSQSNYDTHISDPEILKIFRIIEFIFGDMSACELSDESHKSGIWKRATRNEKIDFSTIDPGEKQWMCNLYSLYADFDFDNCGIEKVNGNKYFYDKKNMSITDDVLSQLEQIKEKQDPMFIEMIDGGLVFS